MKRLIVSLLLSTFIMTTVNATELDLTSMSTEELMELQNAVNTELVARDDYTYEKTIYQGIYYVGEDIQPARYVITPGECSNEHVQGMNLTLFKHREEYEAYAALTDVGEMIDMLKTIDHDSDGIYIGENKIMDFSKYEVISISNCDGIISKYHEKF